MTLKKIDDVPATKNPADADPPHPAVDADPSAAATADQNKIDFNDPTISGQEAVEQNLEAQKGE